MQNLYKKFPVSLHAVTNETADKKMKTFELQFEHEDEADRFFQKHAFMPGQFAMLWVPGVGEIPLGVASSPTERNQLFFTVNRIGKVTRKLHELPCGSSLGIRGPLGNGFPWQELKHKNITLIGGGYAFTTLRSSLVYMLDPAHWEDYGNIRLFYGARNPGMLLYKDELDQWVKHGGVDAHISVDTCGSADWKYHVGLIPSIVAEELPEADDKSFAIVCGPPLMIKFTLLTLREKGYDPSRVFVSLENRMKCGIGHCGRCTIGKVCVCSDGPVFSMTELEDMLQDY